MSDKKQFEPGTIPLEKLLEIYAAGSKSEGSKAQFGGTEPIGRSQSLRATSPINMEGRPSGSPGSAQRITPPTPRRQHSVRRKLFAPDTVGSGSPSGSPGSAQRVSPMSTSGRQPSVSRNLFDTSAAPSSQITPSVPSDQPSSSTSRSYLSTLGSYFGFGGTSATSEEQQPLAKPLPQTTNIYDSRLGQTPERSVRPKIRVPGQPTGMSSSPSPDIVRQFRRHDTGSPDFDKMRQMSRPIPTSELPKMAGLDLASRSQQETARIYGRYGGRAKKEKELSDKDYTYDKFGNRWIRKDWKGPSESGIERRSLQPRSRNERDLYDDRFQQSVDTMGERKLSQIMPTGRLGFGPIPQTSRSYSMSDLQSLRVPGVQEQPDMWSHRERGFAQRLRGLSKEDLKRYQVNRWFADSERYPGVSKRMVPPPTGTNLMDLDKRRVTKYIQRSATAPGRAERRSRVAEYAKMRSTIYPEDQPYPFTRIREREPRRRPDQLSGEQFQAAVPRERRRAPPSLPPAFPPFVDPLKQPSAPSDIRERRQRRWSFDSGQLQTKSRSPIRRTEPHKEQKKEQEDDPSCSIM